MKINTKLNRPGQSERGQTMIIFVFAIVGLLAMVGLAVDGGTILLERRRMQNAADASARAGTRQLAEIMCDDSTTAAEADAAIWNEVVNYARSNGVPDPDDNVAAEYVRFDEDDSGVMPFSPSVPVGNSLSGGDGVPDGAAGVAATTEIERSTHILTLIGIHSAGTSAPAVAVTGPATQSGGLRPFGVPIELVQALGDGDGFKISFAHPQSQSPTHANVIEWEAETAQHFGWMNLDYVWRQQEDAEYPRAVDASGDARKLKDWMEEGKQITLWADCSWFDDDCDKQGDYVGAMPGTVAAAVCEADVLETIVVPVYDHIPLCSGEVPGPKPACPTQGGGYVYHIVGFVAAQITGCSQGGRWIEADLMWQTSAGVPSPNDGYNQGVCEQITLTAVTLWD